MNSTLEKPSTAIFKTIPPSQSQKMEACKLSKDLLTARVYKGKTGVRVSVRFGSPSSLESACHAILRRKKVT